MSNRIGNKKQKLLSRKEELLKELKYYETRIEDARACNNTPSLYEDDSSDSEIEFTINTGTSMSELQLQRSQLQTCLRATEELTGVTVLQAEANVVLNTPAFEGEAPITEDGVWREVMAECRIDLVAFSMTFYTHQPSGMFAPVSYRGLHVMPTKLVHEKELSCTILPTLTTPSDAVEVVRAYAHAHRSRRSSLACLVEKYGDSLYMETAPEGGFVLKCADLLKASWSLQNKGSPVAPFQHRFSFELEHMDETYVATITEAHKQLGDPALETDDRTLLLAEIIDTCLEARRRMGPEPDAQSLNSETNQKLDAESQNSKKPSDRDMDAPTKSSEIMGPPKSLPKKSKAKGKENIVANERKRGNDTGGGSGEGTAKKAKTNSKTTKDKIDKNSAHSKNGNKNSIVNENANSKNSYNEEIAQNAYFSENFDKGNKNTNNLPKVDVKNAEVLKSTDANKAKESMETKSKAVNTKTKVTSAKNVKNNDDIKSTGQGENVSEKELKIKGDNSKKVVSKIISDKKKPSNVKDKNNEGNIENISKNKNPNPKAVAKKNLKTKAIVDKNEPKIKKSKLGVQTNEKAQTSENIVTQPINKTYDVLEPNSKEKIDVEKPKDTAKNNTQKSDKNIKNIAKQNEKNVPNQIIKTNKEKIQNKNLVSPVKQQNFDNNYEKNKKSENNQDLKTNTNNKKVQSKGTLIKSKTNPKKDAFQKPNNIQTLAERFSSKNKIGIHNIEEKSNDPNLLLKVNNKNSNKKRLNNDNLLNNVKTDKNNKVDPNLHEINQKATKNVLKTKLINKNKQLNSDNVLKSQNTNTDKIARNNEFNTNKVTENQNNLKINKNVPKTNLNNKLLQNNQKLRKSLGLKKVATTNNTKGDNLENKLKSKIPQKKMPITKTITKNPLRISSRKHMSKLSSTQNSSKSSTKSLQKQTHIPRLLKKPTVKPN